MFIVVLLGIVAAAAIIFFRRRFESGQNQNCDSATIKKSNKPSTDDSVFSFPETFVAIDTETADSKTGFICQIAAVLVIDGHVTNEKSWLVQPPHNTYSQYNTRIHHISPSMTRDAPQFPEVWGEIESWISSTMAIVAHNASADLSNIRKTLAYYNIGSGCLDVCEISDTCRYGSKRSDLYSSCQYYGIPLDQHHDALCDARACALLAMEMNGSPIPAFIPHVVESKISALKIDVEIQNEDNPFSGKTIVVSGCFIGWPDRDELVVKLRQYGAKVTTSLSSRTDYFVIGEDPGPAKMKRAQELIADSSKLKILTESDLSTMLQS